MNLLQIKIFCYISTNTAPIVCTIWLIIDKDKTPDKRSNSVFLRLVVHHRRQPCGVLRTEKSTNFSLFQVRSSFVGSKIFVSLKPRNADILAYIKALRQKGTEILPSKTILSLTMISHQ